MITLMDGTTIRAELRGDEHVNYWRADDGRCFVMDDNDDKYVEVDVNKLQNDYRAHADEISQRVPSRHKAAGTQPSEPLVGSMNGLIVLVQFNDLEFEEGHDKELYQNIANTENFSNDMGYRGSVHDYFMSQSDNQLDYHFDVVGPITLPNSYSYYGQNYRGNSQRYMKQFLQTSLEAIRSEVDLSKYDNDGDGAVDQIFFLYAGKGEADGGDENTIWPHMYYAFSGYGINFRQNGVYVDVYACSSELQGNGKAGGIGAFCHEFSHCLGLPDMYDTGDEDNYGTTNWDLMHSGCYNGESFVPCGYTAYERAYCGWRQLVELNEATEVEHATAIGEGGDAYVIYNDNNRDEYFILEPRSMTGWDRYIPSNGLLIYHVDYDSYAWWSNTVNNTKNHQRCAIVAADNDYSMTWSSIKGDAYPYSRNNAFDDSTSPASTLFNLNTDGTYNLNKSIYGIRSFDDGTVSFGFVPEKYVYDSGAPKESLFYEGFGRCVGTGGNDGVYTGSVGMDDFWPDNEGWVATNKFGGNSCAKFGTNRQNGKATTPSFTIDGEYVLTFKAAPYATECGGVTVAVNGDATLSETAFRLEVGKWTDCQAVITGTGNVTLTFTGTKRWFLDEVLVMPSDMSAIETHYLENGSQCPSYNLAGQKVDHTYKGIVIVNGKKYLNN